MKFRYDKESDALSITLREGTSVARTEQLDSGTLVDLDRFGNVVAIEILQPNRRWPLDKVRASFDLGDDEVRMLRAVGRDGDPPFPTFELDPVAG